jgi:hypothetical protein
VFLKVRTLALDLANFYDIDYLGTTQAYDVADFIRQFPSVQTLQLAVGGNPRDISLLVPLPYLATSPPLKSFTLHGGYHHPRPLGDALLDMPDSITEPTLSNITLLAALRTSTRKAWPYLLEKYISSCSSLQKLIIDRERRTRI